LATIENQARFSKIIYRSPETRKQWAVFSLDESDFLKPDLGLWQLLRRFGKSMPEKPSHALGDV
jgi:hypothetical protein